MLWSTLIDAEQVRADVAAHYEDQMTKVVQTVSQVGPGVLRSLTPQQTPAMISASLQESLLSAKQLMTSTEELQSKLKRKLRKPAN